MTLTIARDEQTVIGAVSGRVPAASNIKTVTDDFLRMLLGEFPSINLAL
jgi:hypothetical protein